RVHQARMAVAGLAADAPASARVLLIQHDAERDVERLEAEAGEVVGELLDAGFVAHGRVRVRGAGRRIGGIDRALPVHLVELFRARARRLPGPVRAAPCW